MRSEYILLALVAAVSAVPLNINLGAYSPALVVGDGEISFDSSEKASQLMETLATGAANTANAGQQQNQEQQGQRREVTNPIPNLKRAAAPVEDTLDLAREAMEWIKRDIAGFREALSFAREAQKDQPKVELGTPKAGVGITVNAGVNVPANSAANGAPPAAGAAKAKRSEEVAEEVVEESAAPKMTLVAITEV